MIAVTGYSFLAGNHEVYLLEPLRRAGLATFEGDPFVTGTLQYHGLFSVIAGWLFEIRCAKTGFVLIFLGLVLALAWAWWRIARALGGDSVSFLAAVLLYHVLVGDRSLGFYSLLQDGQFNAGNVAAVALVVGIAMRMENKLLAAGAAFGVAGAFHLNYAVVCPPLWVAMTLLQPRRVRSPTRWKRHLFPSLLAIGPALLNVGLALPAKLAAEGGLPLAPFIELYVELRHPHHYNASVWPWWLWLAFVLPTPFVVLAWRRHRAEPAWSVAAVAWLFLMSLQLFALLTAGLWYLGETFVQLSLWRFGPHAKLLAVTALAAHWLKQPQERRAAWLLPTGVALLLSLSFGSLLLRGTVSPPGQPQPSTAIIQAADWAKKHTPPDTLFLVPPGVGSAFPINARRGHVVSFKLVPQLSGELEGWADRLRDVTGEDDLSTFAGGLRGYVVAQEQMDAAYAERSIDELMDVARRHGARFVVRLGSDEREDERIAWRGSEHVTIYRVPSP